jgi:hypothetical protein
LPFPFLLLIPASVPIYFQPIIFLSLSFLNQICSFRPNVVLGESFVSGSEGGRRGGMWPFSQSRKSPLLVPWGEVCCLYTGEL